MKPAEIGKWMYSAIRDLGVVGDKIFPLIAENSAITPFIVYDRVSFENSNTTKDNYLYRMNVEINCITNNYEEGVGIAGELFDFFHTHYFPDEKIITKIDDMSENYENDSFVQKLIIEITIQR